MDPRYSPMRLLRIPEPFDHPDFLFEPKIDGFRALAYVENHYCELVSRTRSSPYAPNARRCRLTENSVKAWPCLSAAQQLNQS
jgi:hypothetical protein